MSRLVTAYLFAMILMLVPDSIMAEGHDQPTTRHPVSEVESRAQMAFRSKCVECHDDSGSDVFGANGLPDRRFFDSILQRMEVGAQGTMPPRSSPQLSTTEERAIRDWIADVRRRPEQAGSSNLCVRQPAGAQTVSEARGRALMNQACTTCHGSMTNPFAWNSPSAIERTGQNLVRMPHTRFLTANGGLLFEQLGVDGPGENQSAPSGFTTLDRLLNQISGRFMPPRRDIIPGVHPEISDSERQELMRWLNQYKRRDSCELNSVIAVRGTTTGYPQLEMNYAAGAERCERVGGWIPTLPQLERLVTNPENIPAGSSGCYFTSSFTGVASTPRFVFERVEANGEVSWRSVPAASSRRCRVFCGQFSN